SAVTGAEENAGTADTEKMRVTAFDFEISETGRVPEGWFVARTGDGEDHNWQILEDFTAPSGMKVLAQTAENPVSTFNLCVAVNSEFKDVKISVAFKAVCGKKDQGGGIVWRYQDEKNYYVVRFNPLESNFRLYKVVDGKRIQMASAERLSAPADQWHTLAVQMKSDAIICFLNGKQYIEANDTTFDNAGKVGLWTKADAQTRFDNFTAGELSE
ncbi:MAG: DUF1080 domain-containing protein, partial [Pontiellaceae bacterium]|nr:DUF1080 domain-containing protein [Pontiellaceae bacterium]